MKTLNQKNRGWIQFFTDNNNQIELRWIKLFRLPNNFNQHYLDKAIRNINTLFSNAKVESYQDTIKITVSYKTISNYSSSDKSIIDKYWSLFLAENRQEISDNKIKKLRSILNF